MTTTGTDHRRYPGAWHAVVDYADALGVGTIIGLPDDELGLVHALAGSAPRFVSCRDQRNAVFATTGYAMQSGEVGVCVLGKGPAITNALTGVLEAACSHAPVVVVSAGTAGPRRGCGAFQELDQVALMRPLTKWAHRVEHAERVVPSIEQAFTMASTGVPGPVYLELPDHLQEAEVVRWRPWAAPLRAAGHTRRGDDAALRAVRAGRRPLLLVGGGMRHRNTARVLERFAESLGAPIFVTASGRGAVDEQHDLFCGLAGLYARPATERLWREADLIIAVGTRLEETATIGWDAWDVTADVVQINIDGSGFSCEFPGPRVLGDGAGVLESWVSELGEPGCDDTWPRAVAEVRTALWKSAPADRPDRDGRTIPVAEVLSALDSVLPPDRVLVQENGLQDMWSYLYPHWSLGSLGGSVVPSEQTSLGFGAAAAGGVKLAAPDRPVVAFVGDGAFNLFRSDLGTFAAEGIAVLYVVLCNGGYGWLQHQLGERGLDRGPWRFATDAGTRDVPGDPPGVHRAVLGPDADLPAEFARALRECDRGRVAVVHVPVSCADTPPGVVAPQTAVEGSN